MSNEIIMQNAKDTMKWFGMADIDGKDVAYVKQECPRWVDHLIDACFPGQIYTAKVCGPVMDTLHAIVACAGDLSAAEQRLESMGGKLNVLKTIAAVLIRRGRYTILSD